MHREKGFSVVSEAFCVIFSFFCHLLLLTPGFPRLKNQGKHQPGLVSLFP